MFARRSVVDRTSPWLRFLFLPPALFALACWHHSSRAQQPIDEDTDVESPAVERGAAKPPKRAGASINKKDLKPPAQANDDLGDGSPRTASSSPRRPIARVEQGPDTLPNDAGQVLRTYDLRPYTR